MFGSGKTTPVDEYQARGEIERVYHEIRQVMRVNGVNLNFRTWAAHGDFLPALWDALQPNVRTLAFERGADALRAGAARAAAALPWPDRDPALPLGESQCFQIGAALDLYHYINPKLLLFTAAAQLALAGETVGGVADGDTTVLRRGIPGTMYPMEMVEAEPEDARLKALFEDIQQTLSLPAVNSDYRTLALWPDYLADAWRRLKPLVARPDYRECCDRLREQALAEARRLPHRLDFSVEVVADHGEDPKAMAALTGRFMALLPGLIIHMALILRDWRSPETLTESPFPARTGGAP